MRVLCIGGGPAGLYFSLLLKRARPEADVTVLERNAADVTFGWGVVFSDETLGNLREADPESFRDISAAFERWDAIDVKARGWAERSVGHGFVGLARKELLRILQARAAALGVRLVFGHEVAELPDLSQYDLVVGADGVRSRVRALYEGHFRPELDVRPNRYVWLGTKKRFDSFQFLFAETPHGILNVHAYRFSPELSTFIVETDEATWRRAGYDHRPMEDVIPELERAFAEHLGGERLLLNRIGWTQFTTVRNAAWSHGNVVLLGDAAHTAHFSIGSGTKLAMEDSIALARVFAEGERDVPAALAAYEADRRPVVERTQKAAEDSLRWFENVRRYWHLEPLQFTYTLLTRSLRVGWENLRLRDAGFVERVQRTYAAGLPGAPPPMFTPFALRGMELKNRVAVAPMCMYSAQDGVVTDFHVAHLGARAMGGAGLVFTEMTDVSPEGRITPGCAGLWNDAQGAAWKRVVDLVHAAGSGARICMQLGHAGRKGSTVVPWLAPPGRSEETPLEEGAWETLAPSALPYAPGMPAPRAMDRGDMDAVVRQFVEAVQRAEAAGFDMVELHLAHGYLLSSFLSPLANRREDAYGGALESRARFPLEVVAACRAAWPKHKPLSVRISATDWAPGGLTGEDSVQVARALKERGVDVVHVSTGQVVKDQRPVFGRMWQTRFSDQIRNEVHIPTIAVGNITTGEQVNGILAAGRADLVALARPHLTDPHWTLREAAAQGYVPQPWPSQYLPARSQAYRPPRP